MHATQALYAEMQDKEEWGFLLVDAANAFNANNRIACLWTARHYWPSSVRFSFNCYRHQVLPLVRADDGYTGHWLWSCEGVTQGNPLVMILYGLVMLPLTLTLKAVVSTALQPLYADDAAIGGNLDEMIKAFNLLQAIGPTKGYFPKLTKSILVVKPAMFEQAKARLDHLGFTIVTGTRYLGGFIGTQSDKLSHIRTKVSEWTTDITRLSSVTRSFPQATFTAFQASYQHEWQYLQHVVPDMADRFALIETAICTSFLPALLGDTTLTSILPPKSSLSSPSP